MVERGRVTKGDIWRDIAGMGKEELMVNAFYVFTVPYGPKDMIRIFKRALVMRGLATEEGAALFAKVSKRGVTKLRDNKKPNPRV